MIRDGQVILLIRFPQTDQSLGKLRPALVICRLPGRHDDWLIAMISSRISHHIPNFDEVIQEEDPDFVDSGLKVASLVRIARLATVAQRSFVGSIGWVSDARIASVKGRISRWISVSPV